MELEAELAHTPAGTSLRRVQVVVARIEAFQIDETKEKEGQFDPGKR